MWRLWRKAVKFTLQRQNPESFRKRFPIGLLIVILATAVNGGCHRLGFLERFEWADSDKLLRHSTADVKKQRMALVLISDQDYDRLFHKRSPLAATPLLNLVKSVCDFGPKIVGVDIFTGDWTAQEALEWEAKVTPLRCKIVWIRDAESLAVESETHYRLGKVLGAAGPIHGSCTALPVFQPDSDGVTRRFEMQVMASASESSTPAPYATLVAALTSPDTCGFKLQGKHGRIEPEKIRFTGNSGLVRLPASEILESSKDSGGAFKEEMRVRLQGATVIIGGAYRQARDTYTTPVGLLFGAEILADAIQTVDNPIREFPLPLVLLVEFVVEVGLLALVMALALRAPFALMTSGVLALLAAFLISWWLFHYSGYFLGVAGAMMGVVLGSLGELLYEPVVHDLHEWREQMREFLERESQPDVEI